jgi:hypothetical protein
MKLIAYKGIVQIDPASIVEPELKRLLNELKHVLNDDTLYDKVCIFIFLLCDLSNDNPLVDRPYNTRREEALEIAFKEERDRFMALKDNNEIIRDTINKCIEIYIKYVNTDEQKDIATYSKKMDQFRVMLNGMKPAIEKNTNIRTNMISYSTNMDIINCSRRYSKTHTSQSIYGSITYNRSNTKTFTRKTLWDSAGRLAIISRCRNRKPRSRWGHHYF